MKLFPREIYVVRSSLSQKEALSRLSDRIERKLNFGTYSSRKIFIGNVEGNRFKISRIISGKNSFLPIIDGVIEAKNNGSVIEMIMRVNAFVLIFMAVWFTGVLLGCVGVGVSIIKNMAHGLQISEIQAVPFVMLVFGVGLFTIPFWLEVKFAKNELNKIFDAHNKS